MWGEGYEVATPACLAEGVLLGRVMERDISGRYYQQSYQLVPSLGSYTLASLSIQILLRSDFFVPLSPPSATILSQSAGSRTRPLLSLKQCQNGVAAHSASAGRRAVHRDRLGVARIHQRTSQLIGRWA